MVGTFAYDVLPGLVGGLARQSVTVLAYRRLADPALAATIPYGAAGHVGFSFDAGRTVWGFGPRAAGGDVLAQLRAGGSFAGQVSDDTAVFAKASQLGATVQQFRYSVSSYRAGRAVLGVYLERLAPRLFGAQYSFPPFANGCFNCATYPMRVGLPTPIPTGRLGDVLPLGR
jgi:hypothetical protein